MTDAIQGLSSGVLAKSSSPSTFAKRHSSGPELVDWPANKIIRSVSSHSTTFVDFTRKKERIDRVGVLGVQVVI